MFYAWYGNCKSIYHFDIIFTSCWDHVYTDCDSDDYTWTKSDVTASPCWYNEHPVIVLFSCFFPPISGCEIPATEATDQRPPLGSRESRVNWIYIILMSLCLVTWHLRDFKYLVLCIIYHFLYQYSNFCVDFVGIFFGFKIVWYWYSVINFTFIIPYSANTNSHNFRFVYSAIFLCIVILRLRKKLNSLSTLRITGSFPTLLEGITYTPWLRWQVPRSSKQRWR